MDADGYRVSALGCGSHSGTHLDAPSHTEPDGRTLDEFPVSRFVRDAVRVDLRPLSPREAIDPADLPTVDADAVVLQTGWDRHWGDSAYLDHPYLSPAGARHCAEQGYDVAIDALNVDPTVGAGGSGDPHATAGAGGSGDPHATVGAGGSGDPHATAGAGGSGDPHATAETPADGVRAHHELLGSDCLIVENLKNVEAVPERFEIAVFPLRITGGDGSPVRAVARWDCGHRRRSPTP